MANRSEINPGNAPGRYYVDSSCIDCDLCRDFLPQVFVRNDEGGFTYVKRQPQTPEEEANAWEAATKMCPSESIGVGEEEGQSSALLKEEAGLCG